MSGPRIIAGGVVPTLVCLYVSSTWGMPDRRKVRKSFECVVGMVVADFVCSGSGLQTYKLRGLLYTGRCSEFHLSTSLIPFHLRSSRFSSFLPDPPRPGPKPQPSYPISSCPKYEPKRTEAGVPCLSGKDLPQSPVDPLI